MFIPSLGQFLEDNYATSEVLNNSTLVIDAKNYFYKQYQHSKLPFLFGCECDKFIDFLKDKLQMFKTANVKCYFILKGGLKHVDKQIESHKGKVNFMAGQDFKTMPPYFIHEIHIQVLTEMGFDYVICENEWRNEIVALAQKLQCPIVSHDVGHGFSGEPYISYYSLKLEEKTGILEGKVFKLDHFLEEKKKLENEEKLAIFGVIMDKSYFPADNLTRFLDLPKELNNKYSRVFSWLANMSQDAIMENIFEIISPEDQEMFPEVKKHVKHLIKPQVTTGIASDYIINGCHIDITRQDPLWFEKGVVSGMIPTSYIIPYRASIVFGSQAIVEHVYKQTDQPDEPQLLSSEIIRYAYDLLTNFQGRRLEIISHSANLLITSKIPTPVYEAQESVFENGWDEIKSLGLFDHFLAHTIPGFQLQILEQLPEDVRLLMIALLFFKRYSNNEAKNEIVGSVLLSFVFLGVVNEKTFDRETIESSNNNWGAGSALRAVTNKDKKKAKNILSKYVTQVSYQTACDRFEPKLMHTLVEFQHCLQNFDSLNKLCGSPYKPIVFSKVYNGTFVYRVLYKMVQKTNILQFLTEQLSSAPTILEFLKRLLEVYNEV